MLFYVLVGVALGAAMTGGLAATIGFGVDKKGDWWGVGLAFRLVIEAVLVAAFVGAVIGVAVIGQQSGWALLGGYAAVRGLALLLEVVKS